ncbi:hypothetical protein A3SI_09453 [Nitritalea halalkaliphila LW7]|uniref:MORN repeat-containing protein n=1 Tax=Nitritalea halalkaliphila LW7 TaxID=1189621 RepID=I5C4B7_9BACT|nr:hypothetical protein [Nitritalea halalkaliphila]EIM76669.1 hypothetical protein A3SI_09453 [Nitritalea halalkaliphila LW7]
MVDKLVPTTLPLLLFDDQATKEKKKAQKKKKRKNVYFGEKTSKGMTRQKYRGANRYEFFHYTTNKKPQDTYIRDIYWFDKRDKVVRVGNFDPQRGYLLHGPYEKRADELLLEEGHFYFGAKHKIWMKYDENSILIGKWHYSEGWPRDSRVSYYDRESRKIEKLTPIEYDLKEGNFFHFYENGKVAVIGEYRYGEPVGLWTEFWNTDNEKVIKKREIQYQENPFDKTFRPFIRAEWDTDGNLIYRRN